MTEITREKIAEWRLFAKNLACKRCAGGGQILLGGDPPSVDCPDCRGTGTDPDVQTLALLDALESAWDWIDEWSPKGAAAATRRAEEAEAENIKLQAEMERLREWKKGAMAVEQEWDAQEISKMLGGQLGQSCRKIVAEKVPQLIARVKELEAEAELWKRRAYWALADYRMCPIEWQDSNCKWQDSNCISDCVNCWLEYATDADWDRADKMVEESK